MIHYPKKKHEIFTSHHPKKTHLSFFCSCCLPRKTQGHPNGFGGNLGIGTSKKTKRLGICITPFFPNDSYGGPYDIMFRSNLLCISIIPINFARYIFSIFSRLQKVTDYLVERLPYPAEFLQLLSWWVGVYRDLPSGWLTTTVDGSFEIRHPPVEVGSWNPIV